MTLILKKSSHIFMNAKRKIGEDQENPWKMAAGIRLWW